MQALPILYNIVYWGDVLKRRFFMMGSKCGCRKLCPLSFGLALGITAALSVILWTLWAIYYGPTQMMTTFNIPTPSMNDGLMCALWVLLKGFILGFFIALFYDLFACCCPCCRKCKCACCRVEHTETGTMK